MAHGLVVEVVVVLTLVVVEVFPGIEVVTAAVVVEVFPGTEVVTARVVDVVLGMEVELTDEVLRITGVREKFFSSCCPASMARLRCTWVK
jgi:hypothetical protein